jgi:hypothetical protein
MVGPEEEPSSGSDVRDVEWRGLASSCMRLARELTAAADGAEDAPSKSAADDDGADEEGVEGVTGAAGAGVVGAMAEAVAARFELERDRFLSRLIAGDGEAAVSARSAVRPVAGVGGADNA